MSVITTSKTIYTNNDWLSSFAYQRAADKVEIYKMDLGDKGVRHLGQGQYSSKFYNTSGVILNISAVASVIFAVFSSTPFALPIGTSGLILGSLCVISDIRESFSPPPYLNDEQIKDLFA